MFFVDFPGLFCLILKRYILHRKGRYPVKVFLSKDYLSCEKGWPFAAFIRENM